MFHAAFKVDSKEALQSKLLFYDNRLSEPWYQIIILRSSEGRRHASDTLIRASGPRVCFRVIGAATC